MTKTQAPTTTSKTDELQGQLNEMSVETRKLQPVIADDTAKVALRLKLEGKIEKAQRSFITITNTLGEIRDQKLYLAGYKTFRAYLGQRWELDYASQSRMDDAIDVIAALQKPEHELAVDELPFNEGQTRQLSRVFKKDGEAELVRVWKDVREQAKARKAHISGSLIVEVAKLQPAAQPTTPTVNRFEGKAHFATVTLGNEDDANKIAKEFAPSSETHSHKGEYAVNVGIDAAEELGFVLDMFEKSKSSEMTIRIVR